MSLDKVAVNLNRHVRLVLAHDAGDDISAVRDARVDCRDGSARVERNGFIASRLKSSLRLGVLSDGCRPQIDRGVPARDHCVYPAERSGGGGDKPCGLALKDALACAVSADFGLLGILPDGISGAHDLGGYGYDRAGQAGALYDRA